MSARQVSALENTMAEDQKAAGSCRSSGCWVRFDFIFYHVYINIKAFYQFVVLSFFLLISFQIASRA